MALFLDRALAATPVGPGGNSAAGGNCAATCLNVNSDSTGTGEYNYDDIDGGSVTFEGHNSIVEIYQLGITGDLSTVRAFNPSSAITRATMATWVTNALAHTNTRPAGLWIQASTDADGFSNNASTTRLRACRLRIATRVGTRLLARSSTSTSGRTPPRLRTTQPIQRLVLVRQRRLLRTLH